MPKRTEFQQLTMEYGLSTDQKHEFAIWIDQNRMEVDQYSSLKNCLDHFLENYWQDYELTELAELA